MDGFLGINIARKALETSQYGMDVTAHNIANANTPGFSRQRAILGTTDPFPAPEFNRPLIQGQMGTGVKIRSIERVRDSYFDGQIRKENQSLGSWQIKDNALKQVETIFNEPSEVGLQNLMSEYWNSWQQLSKNPESLAARSAVIESGRMLASAFNQLDNKLNRLRDNLNEQLGIKINDVNDIAQRLGEINKQILATKAYGVKPNDLLDERDLLLDQLSKMVDVSINELDTGVVVVTLNGTHLVSEYQVNKLTTVPNGANNGYYDVQWAVSGLNANIYGGELKGLMDARDTIVPVYQKRLDDLAVATMTEVNARHLAGFDLSGNAGVEFFDPLTTGAANFAINPPLLADPRLVAAAGAAGDVPGGNTNALSLAQLKDVQVTIGVPPSTVTATLNDFYRSVITDLGIESQNSGRMVTNGKLYYDLVENHRQSVSGVSLDEEATQMIKYQRAYQAAARVITIFDDMLDTLINRMLR